MTELNELIKAEGIEYWAITDLKKTSSTEKVVAEYRQWINDGRHGQMHYLKVHEPMKYHPQSILPGAQSIICMALSYFPGRKSGQNVRTQSDLNQAKQPSHIFRQLETRTPKKNETQATGRVSIYALGRDYHREFKVRLRRIVKKLETLFPDESFRSFTDTAPLHERYYSQESGLTFTGKNTLSLHHDLGSFFFIAEIICTKSFLSTTSHRQPCHCPQGCTRCIDICPTGALEAAFRIDASKCISYLTIEHSGPIPRSLRRKMGNWIFGCDLCQNVCPFNVRAQITEVDAFRNPLIASEQNLSAILGLRNHEDFTAMFAGTPVMRAGRVNMVRNALIAAANTASRSLLPQIRLLSKDQNPVIAEAAVWTLTELGDRRKTPASSQ